LLDAFKLVKVFEYPAGMGALEAAAANAVFDAKADTVSSVGSVGAA
jgi:hypothetical protein